MYYVRLYVTQRGDNPVQKFLEGLDKHTQAKVTQLMGLLQDLGPLLKRPFADKVQDKIYELRSKQARILYFFTKEREIIMVHGFLKKSDAINSADIDTAERRRRDWILRNRVN